MRFLGLFGNRTRRGDAYEEHDGSDPQHQDVLLRAGLGRIMRRRLSDDLEGLIARACSHNNYETAEELSQVLQSHIDRERRRFPNDRRDYDALLERVAERLELASRSHKKLEGGSSIHGLVVPMKEVHAEKES